jgi:hypothetical protein
VNPIRRLAYLIETHAATFIVIGMVGFTYLGFSLLSANDQLHRQDRRLRDETAELRSIALGNMRRLAIEEDAYCKLKFYDETSGRIKAELFARQGVLTPAIRRELLQALELVSSIPSASRCDAKPVKRHRGRHRNRRHLMLSSVRQIVRTFERLRLSPVIAPAPAPRRTPHRRLAPRRVPAPAPESPRPSPPSVAPPPPSPPLSEPPRESEPPKEGPAAAPCPQPSGRSLCHEHGHGPVDRPPIKSKAAH